MPAFKYTFKIDGVAARIDQVEERVYALGDVEITEAEQPVAYAAACLFIASNLVELAGDVHEDGDMGQDFLDQALNALDSRWVGYAFESHRDIDELPTLTTEEVEERMAAMRARMSDFSIE